MSGLNRENVLQWASCNGHLPIVKYLLLEEKADINDLDSDAELNSTLRRVLQYAKDKGLVDVFNCLQSTHESREMKKGFRDLDKLFKS